MDLSENILVLLTVSQAVYIKVKDKPLALFVDNNQQLARVTVAHSPQLQ